MLKNGTYAAWFRTWLADGTGIVHVADGKLWGSDAIMLYSGTYEVDGERFSAVLTASRHSEGHSTVFGTDDLVVRLEGAWSGAIAICLARHAPKVRVLAVDASPAALEVARRNVAELGVAEQVELRSSDLFESVPFGMTGDIREDGIRVSYRLRAKPCGNYRV